METRGVREGVESAIDVPVPIVTSRLMLRPPQAGDGAVLHEAKRESWDALLPWLVWTQKPLDELTVADDEEFCRRKQALFVSREDLTFLHFNRESGRLTGGAGLHQCDWRSRVFTLGFWVRTADSGQGYATEVADALIHYAFNALSASRIVTRHAVGNDASRRVIEKVGFVRETTLSESQTLLDDVRVDEHVYGMGDMKAVPPLTVRWG